MKNVNSRLKEVFSTQSRYCYPNTEVLINKLNITNQEELDKAEATLSLFRLSNIQMHGIPDHPFSFTVDYYLKIHEIVFSDLYDFAGQIRGENIVKANPFCRPEYIFMYLKSLLEEMPRQIRNIKTRKELIKFLAYYYSEINLVHPFREGNGRILREFLRQTVVYINKDKNFDFDIDYSKIDSKIREDLINGSIESAVTGKTDKLEEFFDAVLIGEVLEKTTHDEEPIRNERKR